jgi:hypothetical protein
MGVRKHRKVLRRKPQADLMQTYCKTSYLISSCCSIVYDIT